MMRFIYPSLAAFNFGALVAVSFGWEPSIRLIAASAFFAVMLAAIARDIQAENGQR